MCKTIKRILSLFLSAALLCGVPALTLCVGAEESPVPSQNSIISFGSYPQSEVKDADLIAALNEQSGEWQSYRYYKGTGSYSDGKMKAADFMRYRDVIYDGCKYRAVTFDRYRPAFTYEKASLDENTLQDQKYNGYTVNGVYWFRYEPLQWRVLDRASGLVMCNSIIDSQPFNNYWLPVGTDEHGQTAYWGDAAKTYYADNYAHSSVRAWLVRDFCDTAFSDDEQSNICTSVLNNNGYHTLQGLSGYAEHDAPSTSDGVFLLSWDEATNGAYGFDAGSAYDRARLLQGSDYAKCQGLRTIRTVGSVSGDGCAWILRTSGDKTFFSCGVSQDGDVTDACTVCQCFGICPAMRLNRFAVSVSVESERDSTVTGAGSYFVGDTVTLTAHPNGKEYLNGWYVDGVRVCTEPIYTFPAEQDVTVRAVFTHGCIGGVALDDRTMQAKTTAQLNPNVQSNDLAYTLTYTSSDPKVAAVDEYGTVTALKKGTTTITVTATDEFGGSAQTTCTVTVRYAFWQILIRIFLLGFIWY